MHVFISDNIYTNLIFAIFIASLIIQLYYYLVVYLRTGIYKNNFNKSDTIISVSVIIAAKNEEKNIQKKLIKILEQDHPDFEVIVIDDASTDGTAEVLTEYQKKYPELKIISLTESLGKKNALTYGIKQAKNQYLLFIDADCYPVSEDWISLMTTGFNEKKEIVLAYGGYKKEKGFLNNFICYDSFFISLQYFGAALIGKAYMGVGRNMAYKKDLWHKYDGYKDHQHILSGDDDLFVISAANKDNVEIIIHPDAKTLSETKSKFKDFCNQKCRHFSAVEKYRIKDMFYSGGELIARTIFYFTFFLLLFTEKYFFATGILILRYIIQAVVLYNFANKIKEIKLFYYYVFFDIFAILIYKYLLLYNLLIYNKRK